MQKDLRDCERFAVGHAVAAGSCLGEPFPIEKQPIGKHRDCSQFSSYVTLYFYSLVDVPPGPPKHL